MIGTFFESKLAAAKNAKKWDTYVLFWDDQYTFLKKANLPLIIWDGMNGRGRELFDGTKLTTAPRTQHDGFVAILKKDLV